MSASEVLNQLGITTRDLFYALLSDMLIVDYGVVKTVHGSPPTSIEVRHAVQPKAGPIQLGTTETDNVQILWLSSAGLSVQGKVAVGDRVLLVGFKDLVDDVAGTMPAPTDIDYHYCRETMKAIPLGAYEAGSTHTIDASGTVMKIDGGTKGAARQDDATIANSTTDPTFWIALAALCAHVGISTPGSLTGKVNAGSAKVQVG